MRKFLFRLALLFFLIHVSTRVCGQTGDPNSQKGLATGGILSSALMKLGHETPDQLAMTLIEAIRDNDLTKFKSAVPLPEQLQLWFDTLSHGNSQNSAQKEWMLKRSKSLHSGEAKEMLEKIRKSGSASGIPFTPIGSGVVNISTKYFYYETDIFVPLPNGRHLKIKDCINSPGGWCFLSEIKIK